MCARPEPGEGSTAWAGRAAGSERRPAVGDCLGTEEREAEVGVVRVWRGVAVLAVVGACGGGGDGSPADVASSEAVPGAFTERWSAQVEGDAGWLVAGDGNEPYVILDDSDDSEGDATYAVVALAIGDGSERWRTPLTETGCCDGAGVDAIPTEGGLLASFDDADGGHLVLLDETSGEVRWDTTLETSTYDLWGEIEPGLGYVSLDETTSAFVDLDDGAILEDELDWLVFDDRLSVVEDGVLRVGVDPFDSDAETEDIDLAGLNPTAVHRVASQVVVVDGEELVGIADGQEVFRIDAGVGPIGESGVVEDQLVAVSDTQSTAETVVFVTVENDHARVVGRAPENFEQDSAAVDVVQGDALVAGLIDDDPPTDSPGETNELVLLELGTDGVVTRASTNVSTSERLSFAGGRVVVDHFDELQVLSATDLSEVARITLAEDFPRHAIGSDYIATLNRDSENIRLWR